LKNVISQKVQSVPSPAAHGAILDRQVTIAGPDVKEGLIQQASLDSDRFVFSPAHDQPRTSKFVVGLALSLGTCSLMVSPFSGVAVATKNDSFSSSPVLPITAAVSKEDVYMQQLRQDVSSLRTQNGTDAVFVAPLPQLVAQRFDNSQATNIGVVIPVHTANDNAAVNGIAIPVPAPRTYKLPALVPSAPQVAINTYNAVQTQTTNQTAPPVGVAWPAKGTFTSGYGRRWGRMHKGIDIAAPVGTPIVAAADGVVVISGWDRGGFGNRIDIQHADGTRTLYAHNSRLLVAIGQQVKQGQQISAMGSTGHSTGPHLHFEFHVPGGSAVNPVAYLPSGARS
jgi:murein DD-endopeptidase MepM/ murein hydrolase activator NlpD